MTTITPPADAYFFSVKKLDLDPVSKTWKENSKPFMTFGNDIDKSSPLDKLQTMPRGEGDKYVTSITIEEELYNSIICNMTVVDMSGIYAKAFTKGQRYRIRWGVKSNVFRAFKSLFTIDKETLGALDNENGFIRGGSQGIDFFIFESSWSMSGVATIWSLQLRGGLPTAITSGSAEYPSGSNSITLKEVVKDTLQKINPRIKDDQIFVKLDAKAEAATTFTTKNKLVRTNKTPNEFFYSIAKRFMIEFAQVYRGFETIYCFYSKSLVSKDELNLAAIRGVSGKYHYMNYGAQDAIILTLDGSQVPTSSGSIAVPVPDPTGKVSLQFQPGQQQTALVYEWKTGAEKDAAKRQAMKQFGTNEVQELQRILKVDSSNMLDETGNLNKEIAMYFKPKTVDTFPEGQFQEVNATIIPNPIIQVGDRVWLGAKETDSACVIPPTFRTYDKATKTGSVQKDLLNKSLWRIYKQTYTHNESGVTHKLLLKR